MWMRSVIGHIYFDVYLSWGITADELVEDFLGLGCQFGWFGHPVVLAGQVEGDVFLAELRDEKRSEQAQSI